MKNPAIAMTKNLMWTTSGVVWATWRLQSPTVEGRPIMYPFAPEVQQQEVIAHHQALYQALRGEAVLMGLRADVDPGEIVGRMLEGLDASECPEWITEIQLTLDALESIQIGTRAFWLAVPLNAGGIKGRLQGTWAAQQAMFRQGLALPKWRPSPAEIESASLAAKRIEDTIPKAFNPTPAPPAEQTWIALQSQRRGLPADMTMPLPSATASDATSIAGIGLRSASEIPHAFLDEGAQTDIATKSEKFTAFNRRYLKVQSSWSEEPSYQVLQVLAASPKHGWQSPGCEWMSFVDQLPFDVDWIQRFRVSDGRDVRRRNESAENALNDQLDHRANSRSITGPGAEMHEVAESLSAYQESLNSSEQEVEVEATVIFATGGETAEVARTKARILAAEYRRFDFILDTPLGSQEALWWSALPGIPWLPNSKEFSQITSGREFATGVPILSFELGDPKGARFGVNISTGGYSLILSDKDGAITGNTSASYGVVGALGSGKSVLMKCDMGETLDRNGRVIAIDRTVKREYATFARSLSPDNTAIVDLLEPEYSLDPLRVFGPIVGARMVQSLFSTLLGIGSLSDRGAALSSVLEPQALASRRIDSLRGLVTFLGTSGEGDLQGLVKQIRIVASKDLGRVLFDDGLPPLDVNKRAIAFLTAGLSLPDESELNNAHRYDALPLEKIVGRSMYAMLMGITRTLCFQDDSELAGAFIDEIHTVTQSPEGLKDFSEHVSDGRKHRTFVAAGSQDPAGFGNTTTRGLLQTRYVMRQTDENLAFGCVKWLTSVHDDEDVPLDIVKAVTQLSPVGANNKVLEGREGEGFMRDQLGRIGKFQRLLPERPDRRLAVLSTPPTAAAAKALTT